MHLSDSHRLVVVGGSAGSLEPMLRMFRNLPSDHDASFLVVQHIGANSPQFLSELISRAGVLPAEQAQHGRRIEPGRVFVAPPDHHLLVHEDVMLLSHGPRENRTRPAIDPLFRSAAVSFGPSVVGVLLSGMLDDGSAGLVAIKRCGGVTIVQDPEDAAYPDMPQSALTYGGVDHRVRSDEMSTLITSILRTPPVVGATAPDDLRLEVEITERMNGTVGDADALGERIAQSCPECGGPLWHVNDESVDRFRCTVGHSYTTRALLVDQQEAVERALWAAMRTLQEREKILESLIEDVTRRSHNHAAASYRERLDETRDHVEQLRKLLTARG